MTTADDVHTIEVVVRRVAVALVWGDDGRRVCDECRLNWWLTSLCSSLVMPRRPGHVGRAATTAALARGKFGNRAQLSVRAAAPHARARVRSDEEVRRDCVGAWILTPSQVFSTFCFGPQKLTLFALSGKDISSYQNIESECHLKAIKFVLQQK